MVTSQTVITRAVKNYKRATGYSQAKLAGLFGVSQSTMSQKLAGVRKWSYNDLDVLIELEVIEPLALMGELE